MKSLKWAVLAMSLVASAQSVGAENQLRYTESSLREIQIPSPVSMKYVNLGQCLDARSRRMGSKATWSEKILTYRNGKQQEVIELKQTIRGHDWSFVYFDAQNLSFVRSEFIQNKGAPAVVGVGQRGWYGLGMGCEADIRGLKASRS